MNRMQIVIFDMDGVLVETEPVYERMYREVYRRFGLELPQEEREFFIGRSSTHIWTYIKNKYSLSQTLEELIRMKEDIYEEMLRAERLAPIPGVVALLDALREQGRTLAIASSSKREIIDYIISAIGVADRFSFISSGDAVSKGKPDPEIFLKVSSHFGCEPSRCVVIEDAASGVKGAKAAGMTVFAYRNPNSGEQDLSSADAVFRNYDEATRLFEEIGQSPNETVPSSIS